MSHSARLQHLQRHTDHPPVQLLTSAPAASDFLCNEREQTGCVYKQALFPGSLPAHYSLFYSLSGKLALFVHNVYQLVLPYCVIVSLNRLEVQM